MQSEEAKELIEEEQEIEEEDQKSEPDRDQEPEPEQDQEPEPEEINPEEFKIDNEELESQIEDSIKQQQQKKSKSYDTTKLLRIIAVVTSKRVPKEHRQQYINDYVEVVGMVHDWLNFGEVIKVHKVKELPPKVRLFIGIAAMIAGPFIIPKVSSSGTKKTATSSKEQEKEKNSGGINDILEGVV